ncbi:MAG: TIGR02221 family CRISPR-associated protein [Bryobacterales bacterium]|nr:TIGR02221 family CRISPR-associated protein [Bryobacteraceae bacterium]MDW8130342.1 TIGR02221 family CRISPR-associated protein [Bryobacterales bacterium]
MALVQVSFLGRVQQGQDGYVRVRYGFADGEQVEAAFFGFALAGRLRPSRLAVLGTAGSMWHTLLDLSEACPREAEIRVRLEANSRSGSTTQEELEVAAGLLSARWECDVRLVRIPYGRSPEEQVEILERIAEQVAEGDEVALDVTHGLRHLPMLGLVSAVLLGSVRGARVRGVYYGALDMRVGEVAPVLELSGLLAIAEWGRALARFEGSGDYGALAHELAGAGLPEDLVHALRKASFFEQVCRYGQAVNQLNQARSALRRGIAGPARLLTARLQNVLDRVKATTLAERQYLLARAAWERGDLLRAVTLLQEATITALSGPWGNPEDIEEREAVKKAIREGMHGPPELREPFRRLSLLRNLLVHGRSRTRDPEVQVWLDDPERLRAGLEGIFASIERVVLASGPEPKFPLAG